MPQKLATLAVTHGGSAEQDPSMWNVTGMADAFTGAPHGPWKGEKALGFMSQFDMVLLWHWPSPYMCKELAVRNVKVVPFIELDAVKTYAEWGEANEALRKVFVSSNLGRHMSQTMNSFGHPFVDIYETASTQWDKKPHAWSIDLWCGLEKEYARTLRKVWNSYRIKPEAVVVDSMNERQYFGTATNAPKGTVNPPWFAWIEAIQHRVCPVIAHSGGFFDRTAMTVSELGLRQPLNVVMTEMARAKNEGRTLALAPQNLEQVYIVRDLVSLGFEPDMVQYARSGQVGFEVDWFDE